MPEKFGVVTQPDQYPQTGQYPNQEELFETFVTRQEFLALLSRKIGVRPEYGSVHFIDVYDESTDLYYIYPMLERGIVAGYPDGTFRPYEYITKNEAEIIIARVTNQTVPRGIIVVLISLENKWLTCCRN